MNQRSDNPQAHSAGGYARLRPVSSKPLGVLALAAVSRVGTWAPPLPRREPEENRISASPCMLKMNGHTP